MLKNKQHLVLVHNDPVSLVEQVLQAGVGVGYLLPAEFGVDEPAYVLHWPRTVQRDHGRNFAQVGGFQLFDVTLHPGAFQLEHVGGITGGQQRKGFFVVQGQAVEVNFDAAALLNQVYNPVQDGQVGQAQEVHLQQTQLGDRVHGKLGHKYGTAFVPPGWPLQGHRSGQRFVSDQHARGVGADVVNDSLQALGGVHQLVDCFLLFVGCLHLRSYPDCVIQGSGLQGHHAGHPVYLAVSHGQGSTDIPQSRPGAQGPKGNYLGDFVPAVTFDDVVQHLVSPVVLEVQVYVRQLLPFQVEEPFKDQAVFQGVDDGDPKTVESHAAGGAASYTVKNAVLTGEINDVPNYQEVIGEMGLVNYFQLVTKPVFRIGSGMGVSFPKSLPAEFR